VGEEIVIKMSNIGFMSPDYKAMLTAYAEWEKNPTPDTEAKLESARAKLRR
jgi:hypothetical protein